MDQVWWESRQDVDGYVSSAAVTGARRAYGLLHKLLDRAMYDVAVRVQVVVRFGNGEVQMAEQCIGNEEMVAYLRGLRGSKEGGDNAP